LDSFTHRTESLQQLGPYHYTVWTRHHRGVVYNRYGHVVGHFPSSSSSSQCDSTSPTIATSPTDSSRQTARPIFDAVFVQHSSRSSIMDHAIYRFAIGIELKATLSTPSSYTIQLWQLSGGECDNNDINDSKKASTSTTTTTTTTTASATQTPTAAAGANKSELKLLKSFGCLCDTYWCNMDHLHRGSKVGPSFNNTREYSIDGW
jgi:guanyl-specific ribonuclease Sa